ncbi:LptF/LptG family permease, partial [Desulfovibrio sp. OttesenSCG-928-A18]|nr:LptF/LptG family permease [Desulfovibrio sp. OttesenSCG-928-A18]
MSLLSRYLVRQNLFLLMSLLLVGMGIYLLTDLFERLDNFLDSEAGVSVVLLYFLTKLPMIVSQILPAVYILALVLQCNFLERNRELLALFSGGVSPLHILRFVLIYSLVWALAQFAFAQALGVAGEKASARIWQEDINGNSYENVKLERLWFTENNMIVHIGVAFPVQKRGSDLVVYVLDPTGQSITEVIKAASFSIRPGLWLLEQGSSLVPAEFSFRPFASLELPLQHDLQAFQLGRRSSIRPSHLTLMELGENIERLERAGSNVELLRTAWHAKLSYAASIIIMGLLAVIISRLTNNIYKAGLLALLIVFFYYGLNVFSMSLGEKGILAPVIGAWLANGIFFLLSALLLSMPS